MGKSSCVLKKDSTTIYGLGLCEYLKTRDIRQKLTLYKLENSLIAEKTAKNKYKILEKEFSNEPLKKNKKIIKLQ